MDAQVATFGAFFANANVNVNAVTPAVFSAHLDAMAAPEFSRIRLHVSPHSVGDLAALSHVNWQSITALGQLVITLYFSPRDTDDEVVSLVRCIMNIIASLQKLLPIESIAIYNPLPPALLRSRATHDVSGLITELKRVWYSVDVRLHKRMDASTLGRVILAKNTQGFTTHVAEDEKPRVREFFRALADFHDVI
ncbi:hypothetical protein PsYK624_081080 [Phanerochaete sordida]|uniref:Uncharacterized protein n=1 Tax=Phanerochaete sordida TaxID=48140 RepID=A0A9P3GBR5_9APHY|nr:hypothetical protein PsYK624_081080 [Phanerochaete sordida]